MTSLADWLRRPRDRDIVPVRGVVMRVAADEISRLERENAYLNEENARLREAAEAAEAPARIAFVDTDGRTRELVADSDGYRPADAAPGAESEPAAELGGADAFAAEPEPAVPEFAADAEPEAAAAEPEPPAEEPEPDWDDAFKESGDAEDDDDLDDLDAEPNWDDAFAETGEEKAHNNY